MSSKALNQSFTEETEVSLPVSFSVKRLMSLLLSLHSWAEVILLENLGVTEPSFGVSELNFGVSSSTELSGREFEL